LAVTAIEPREPVTVPSVIEVPVLVALWLRENCVPLMICEIVVPNGIPVPETGWPTTRPAVLVVVTVELAVVPIAVIGNAAFAMPIAKLGLMLGVTEVPLARPPTVNVLPVELASVMVVALEIALMNQLPVKPDAVTGWPRTRLAVLGKVRIGAVVVPALTAFVVRAAVAPVIVPSVIEVPVLTAVWLSVNCVALKICEIVVPGVTPVPETGWPTTRPAVLGVVTVELAVVPIAVIERDPAVPMEVNDVPGEVICQVPESNFVTAAADVVLLMMPWIWLMPALAPPTKSV
jgi:hypothetical protein